MNKDELIRALSSQDFEPYRAQADRICRENFGDVINIRAILEYSNYCSRICKYCGLNSRNNKLERYRLSDDEIISTANAAYAAGYKTLVLQGGEDPMFTPRRLADIIREVVKSGIVVTLSAGEMSREDLALIRASGASRYLLKHETSDESLYTYLHGDYTLARRLECLRNIKELGFETGSGFMIGLPTQTLDTIADDILLLQSLGCDMAGIGPFIPHEDTPLKDIPHGSGELTRRAVALTRILMPKINLPATTSLHVLEGEHNRSVFDYGANVIMRKVTPTYARALYEIYPSDKVDTDIVSERRDLEEYIKSLGRTPL